MKERMTTAEVKQGDKLIKNSSSKDGEIKEEKEMTIAEEEKTQPQGSGVLGGMNNMTEKALGTVQNLPGMEHAKKM